MTLPNPALVILIALTIGTAITLAMYLVAQWRKGKA